MPIPAFPLPLFPQVLGFYPPSQRRTLTGGTPIWCKRAWVSLGGGSFLGVFPIESCPVGSFLEHGGSFLEGWPLQGVIFGVVFSGGLGSSWGRWSFSEDPLGEVFPKGPSCFRRHPFYSSFLGR